MQFSIETLEIELARLRKSLRIANETNISFTDTQEGIPPDFKGMNEHIDELEVVISLLNESNELLLKKREEMHDKELQKQYKIYR